MDFNLDRFVNAQASAYPAAFAEMQAGCKRGHWIWYIFPQLAQLGYSSNARYFGISGMAEAKAYLAHPVLGARLREISRLLLMLDGSDPVTLMSSYVDAMKLRSSMTLFAEADGYDSVFGGVLDKYFQSGPDSLTIDYLRVE